jgi:hypothetical protein
LDLAKFRVYWLQNYTINNFQIPHPFSREYHPLDSIVPGCETDEPEVDKWTSLHLMEIKNWLP